MRKLGHGWPRVPYNVSTMSMLPCRMRSNSQLTHQERGQHAMSANINFDLLTAPSVQPQERPAASLPALVASQLTGVKRVTISAPGVLLEEWDSSQLQVSDRLLCFLRRTLTTTLPSFTLAFSLPEVLRGALSCLAIRPSCSRDRTADSALSVFRHDSANFHRRARPCDLMRSTSCGRCSAPSAWCT